MSSSILSHAYAENQQSSWIDDPFQVGTSFVNGVTRTMSHEQKLLDYAEELVGRYAKYQSCQYELCLDMLPEDEQHELARLFIEHSDRDMSECIYGDDFTINNDFTCAVLKLLTNDSTENRDELSSVVRKNILIYYKKTLDELLDEACDNFLHLTLNEQLDSRYDDDIGDVVWGRF